MGSDRYSYFDDRLEACCANCVIKIPVDALGAIRIRTTYFYLPDPIKRKLYWRKVNDGSVVGKYQQLDLITVKPSRISTTQTVVNDLMLDAFGVSPGDTMQIQFIHDDHPDLMSILLRIDIEIPTLREDMTIEP